MKIVLNKCYGGFNISPLAVQRLAELQGKKAYFFEIDRTSKADEEVYLPLSVENAEKKFIFFAFSVPNPKEILDAAVATPWSKRTQKQHQAFNNAYRSIELTSRPDDRSDPLLVQVVTELGEAAAGSCAKLEVIEIPDGVNYEIKEYDGMEHVAEVHRTWS
jgi:hypothetical protein